MSRTHLSLALHAPMAGITDLPFRRIIAEWHPGPFFTEMLSAEALVRKNPRTEKMAAPGPGPTIFQIVSSNPIMAARAAAICVEKGAQGVDLNAGCPDPHVVRKGMGGALLKRPEALRQILVEMKKAVDAPISVKLRSGWKNPSVAALANALVEAEVDMATFHPRTVSERYNTPADHRRTKTFVEILHDHGIPVVANGDIKTARDAKALMDFTGADGVMVARAILGKPWAVGNMNRQLRGEKTTGPEPHETAEIFLRHARLSAEFYGEKRGIKKMRKHALWYFKKEAKDPLFREMVRKMETLVDAEGVAGVIT